MPTNQKLENLLNLSLDTTAEERSRSAELETGYNPEEQTWELIVKYHGSLDGLREQNIVVGAWMRHGSLALRWRRCVTSTRS